ncbi:hypothetical protein CC80DRAFT_492690 [Byssothecium circinans]|uniref:Family c-likeg-protein-coupled receptor protein n=1 Tax=Byssothecium circinans TaxID=147558 RepID=A0A6A5TVD0_9PLEO|nr:hypothetical protein CC80DRAFT_492690 [Byssothecium circinans]
MASGPPYRPTVWALGGLPDRLIDTPITAVFLVLFIFGAAIHMTIFQFNKRRGHKFVFNGMIFGFCMSRIVTTSLKIASVSLPNNIRLAIAAQIFTAAGVIVVFIINLVWSQRILRSMHPNLGWHTSISLIFKTIYVLVIFTLAILITATVQSFFTLRQRTKTIDRDLQLYGATFLAIISFLPIPIVRLSYALPRKSELEKFGQGRHRTKTTVLIVGTTLCCLGASFRCGTFWLRPVPLSQPCPAYFSKTWFYVMNFGVEILVVYFYAAMRVDLRFWVPNGAKGAGSYGGQGSKAAAGTGTGTGTEGEDEENEDEQVESRNGNGKWKHGEKECREHGRVDSEDSEV